MKKYRCTNKCAHAEHGNVESCEVLVPFRPVLCVKTGGSCVWEEITDNNEPRASCDGEIGACKGCQEALPRLTAEELERRGIQWPEWANYVAVDRDGSASFYCNIPFQKGNEWICEGQWENIKNISISDFKWDASDWQNSLIGRPVEQKLPDWCKVGNWVFETTEQEYHKILELEGTNVTMDSKAGEDYRAHSDAKWLREARLRPWTFEEAQQYLFRPIRFKAIGAILGMIGLAPVNGALFPVCGAHNNVYFTSLEKLSESGELLDGSPCGILEHKHKDWEWVK